MSMADAKSQWGTLTLKGWNRLPASTLQIKYCQEHTTRVSMTTKKRIIKYMLKKVHYKKRRLFSIYKLADLPNIS